MHPLLRFTLDLFEPNKALAPVNKEQQATEIVVPAARRVSPPEPLAAPTLACAPTSLRHPRANREARLCDVMVAYEFKRGQRRSIGFVIRPEGLVVSAPKWVPLHQVDAALQDKSQWIIQKLRETQARQQRLLAGRIEWYDGTMVPYLGQPLQLLVLPCLAGAGASIELHLAPSPTLRVTLPEGAMPEQIRDAVHAWMKRQAQQLFKTRLDHFAPQLQVQWRTLTLSNARTRWGSAHINGAIRLNWRLMHFQPTVIDYVVVHELSHLRVMDHSPRFWATVRSVAPDYVALRRQLKDEALPHGL